MNYYKHHLGDYATRTQHLSLLEHGVYRLLIDACYISEAPLPADMDRVCRVVRAQTKPERQAVADVLHEFFDLGPDGYTQKRILFEIEIYKENATQSQRNGNRGGRPKKTQRGNSANPEITQPVIFHNPEITLTTNHQPSTTNHHNNKTPESGRDDDFLGGAPPGIPCFAESFSESQHREPVGGPPEKIPKNGAIQPEKSYFFIGRMGRILQKDTVPWAKSYHTLTPDDARSVLQNCDDYYYSLGRREPKMFFRYSAWLKKEHDKRMQEAKNGAGDGFI